MADSDPRASSQDALYLDAAADFAPAIARVAAAYEADPDLRRDLEQDIHLALWRSFAGFEGRCAIRTWVYRVAHNVATSHVVSRKRLKSEALVGVEELEAIPAPDCPEGAAQDRQIMARLMAMIAALKPADRQIMLLYLEDLGAAEIGEVTGLSPGTVSVKIHRIKVLLADQFQWETAR